MIHPWLPTDCNTHHTYLLILLRTFNCLQTGLGKKHRRTQLTMNPNGQQVAVVRFETYEEANRALRTCNFGFVRNDQIQLHIII